MNFLKKVSIKLTIIISIFMIIISIINMKLLTSNLEKNIGFTCESHYNGIIDDLDNKIEVLEVITQQIADNDKIIEILDINRVITDLDRDDTTLMNSEIKTFEGILKTLTFIKTINITNFPGSYIFSNGLLYDTPNINTRPWFTEELLDNKGKTIVSDIYRDYNTGKYTISIVDLIYSQKDNSIVGAVVLDVFLDDLIKYINSEFHLGDLETYIKLENGTYYGKNNIIADYKTSSSQYYVKKSENTLKNRLSMLFKFDKESIVYSKSLKEYNRFQIILYSAFGSILTVMLIEILKSTFKPIVTCIGKFKALLKSSEEDQFNFENENEFEQLEFIANTFSKSFDNKIKSLIYYDELTKLPNRKMLIKRVKELIDTKNEFALIFIDLNKFKQVNDLFGHLIGDEILKCFSEKIQQIIKDKDMVIRYSGDEFIILYTDYKGEKDLIDFYENNILAAFKKPVLIHNNNNIMIKFSGGVSIYPRNGESLDELINKSDLMMYENKNNLSEDKLLFFNEDVYKKLK